MGGRRITGGMTLQDNATLSLYVNGQSLGMCSQLTAATINIADLTCTLAVTTNGSLMAGAHDYTVMNTTAQNGLSGQFEYYNWTAPGWQTSYGNSSLLLYGTD
jgi:hypothetical protein